MAKTEAQRLAAKMRRLKRQGRPEEAARVIEENYQVERPFVKLNDPTDYSARTGYLNNRKKVLVMIEQLELLCEPKPKEGQKVRMSDLGNIVEARAHLEKAIKHMNNNRDVVRRD